jgi:hypothetical protein
LTTSNNITKSVTQDLKYDGNGNLIRTSDLDLFQDVGVNQSSSTTRYRLNSTILGEVIVYQSSQESLFPNVVNKSTKTRLYGLGQELAMEEKKEGVAGVPNGIVKTLDIEYNSAFTANRVKSEISSATSSGLTNVDRISSKGLGIKEVRPSTSGARFNGNDSSRFDSDFNELLGGGLEIDGIRVPRHFLGRGVGARDRLLPWFLEGRTDYEVKENPLGIIRIIWGGSHTKPNGTIVVETNEMDVYFGEFKFGGFGVDADRKLNKEEPHTEQSLPTRLDTKKRNSRQKRPKAVFDLDKYKQCLLDLFNTELGPDDRLDPDLFAGFYGKGKDPFSIKIDYSKDKKQIFIDTGKDAVGYAEDNSSRIVYIANDLNSIDRFVTRIHEIGNKIYAKYKTVGLNKPEASAGLRNKLKKIKLDDDDAGMALEECVFGGRVFSDGTVFK